MLPVLDTYNEPPIYPFELRVTDDKFKRIVPLAQNTLCAIKFFNNIAGLASILGYNIQMDANVLSEARSFLDDIGDDDEVDTITKLYKLDTRYLSLYSLTHLLTYLLAYLLTHSLTNSPTYSHSL